MSSALPVLLLVAMEIRTVYAFSGSGRSSFTACRILPRFFPAVALLERRRGKDSSHVAVFGGRAAKRIFLVLRTTGVLTLAGVVSFSATPPLEGGDVGSSQFSLELTCASFHLRNVDT